MKKERKKEQGINKHVVLVDRRTFEQVFYGCNLVITETSYNLISTGINQ